MRALFHSRPLLARPGFTLAESLIASVVLAIAVIGISTSLSAAYKQNSVTGDSGVALGLARELMEEVTALPFDPPSGSTNQPGWPTITDRTQYDTIDDFNGYTDTSNAIHTWEGSSVDAGNGTTFTRLVTVTPNALPTGLTGTASDFEMVTVTVTSPAGDSYSISQLCTRANVER
jgi:prepilin-type N-terminal cleavage/methylation domain-containing protein